MKKNYFFRLGSKIYETVLKSNLFRFFISIFLAVPIAAILFVVLISSYHEATQDIMKNRQARTELTVTLVHERLEKILDIAQSLASRPSLVENIIQNKWDEAVKYIEKTPQEFDYIDSIFLTQTDGTLKAGTGTYEGIINKNFAYRDWYQGVSKHWEPYLSEFYTRANAPQINVISAAVPITDLSIRASGNFKEEEILGILVIQINPEIFLKWSLEADLGEQGFLYAVDKNGTLIFHPDYDTVNEFIDFSAEYPVRNLLDNESGIGVAYDVKRAENRLYSYALCESHGWNIIFEQPASAAFASRDQNLIPTLYLYAFFILLIIFLINLILKYVLNKRKISEIMSQFAFVAENSDDAIYSRDLNGVIMSWNKGAEIIYGYKKEEVLNQSILMLIPQKKEKEYAALQRKILAGERVQKHITSRIRKDGREIIVSLNMSSVEDRKGNAIGISSIASDITMEVKNQELLIEKTRNLEELNRELESFSYAVSHDLRSPLRGIDGFSKALMEDFYETIDDKGKDYLLRIRKASQKMGELIDDLLLLSRITRNEMVFKEVDLSKITKDVSHSFLEAAAREGRKVELTISPNIFVYGDERLLEIMMSNLLENAFKFSNKKEPARIEFGHGYLDGKEVLFVKDNGAGFDMRYVDKIFNPFQRLHLEKEFPGTGIGLVTVKRIIERHQGRIWAQSAVGKGAVFYFTFLKMRSL